MIDFKKMIPAILIGLFLGLTFLFTLPEFSRLGVVLLFELYMLLLLWIIDRLLLTNTDIFKEIIERKNVALVLFILGLIALPILAS